MPSPQALPSLVAVLLTATSTYAQCALTDLACTTTSDDQLNGLLVLALFVLFLIRARTKRHYAYAPPRRY